MGDIRRISRRSPADADAVPTPASAAAQAACEPHASGMQAAVATVLHADNEPPDTNMADRPIRANTTEAYAARTARSHPIEHRRNP